MHDTDINSDDVKDNSDAAEWSLKLQLGMDNERIDTVTGSVLTFGRYKGNDILSGFDRNYISRIQCFMFVVGESLLVMDGWSLLGTRTLSINGAKVVTCSSLVFEAFHHVSGPT